jgi:hypothetical protein
MTASRLASAAGAATLVLLAGCDRPAESTAMATSPPASSPAAVLPAPGQDTLIAADAARETPHRRGGGAFGVGIRPTGSSANGISP